MAATLVLPMLCGLLLPGLRPSVAAAHPLDEYLQATYVTLAPDRVTVELDLSPGVLVVPQVVALIDADGDGAISDDEGRSYAHAVLGDIQLDLDGQRYPLTATKVEVPPMLNLTAGMGTIRLAAVAGVGAAGTTGPGPHQVFVENSHAPVKSVYQSTTVLPPTGGVEVVQQRRDEAQQSLRVEYAVAAVAQATVLAVNATAVAQAVAPATNEAGRGLAGTTAEQRQGWLVDMLYLPAVSSWLLLTALGLSALLGGLHALTPGHGKTLLASYLVGSRGTVRHAVFLGGTVTFTHTASVIAMGVLALAAGHLIVPDLLVPTLELASGLLVVLLGARLVLLRWQSLRHGYDHDHRRAVAEPDHHAPAIVLDRVHEDGADHRHDVPRLHADHGHGHGHGHGHHAENAHNHPHSHPHPHRTDGVRWRDLAMMGVSGGLTPCPEAIGILLVAIGINRISLGLGLIVAFSLGLAAVLCLLGLLIVRSSGLVDRFGTVGQRTQQLLPLGSAIVVTVLGLVISAKGVLAYLS